MTRKTFEDWEHSCAVAERVARWHLGSGHWAGIIIGALLHPDEALIHLEDEMAGAFHAERDLKEPSA